MYRKRRRRISYRPASQRPMRIFRGALVCVAFVALILSVQVIVRSVKTAHVNRQTAALHTVDDKSPAVEVAAPAKAVSTADRQKNGSLTLARMTLPDGSAIAETVQTPITAQMGFHKTSGEVLPDMLKLLNANRDTVGWLNINGIVHLPVLYRDNTYYLTRDFSGHHNTSGALFLDQASPIAAQTQNLLIHGHSMFDGSMFGLLTHYQKLETVRQHPLISFSTLYEKEHYVVFAVAKVDPEVFDYASHSTFNSDMDFIAYVTSIREQSLFDIPVDVRPTDALLALSTCIDDDRLVVFARRMRSEETEDELTSAVKQSGRAIS